LRSAKRFKPLTWTLLSYAGLVILCACGCSRTVIVDDGSPMRVGKATGTVLQRIDGEWVESGETTLPEGWYMVPPRFVE
jgi:hypothetical protein